MKAWAGALLLFIAAPAVAADQFDLICTSPTDKKPTRYRVDLAVGEWCEASCSATQKIAEVTSTSLTLKDEKQLRRGQMASRHWVNRVTGEWQYRFQWLGSPSFTTGHCEPAPFSGFGAEKVKF